MGLSDVAISNNNFHAQISSGYFLKDVFRERIKHLFNSSFSLILLII